jgi:hypothetical protein
MEAADRELDRQVLETINLDQGKDEQGTRDHSDPGQTDVRTELGTHDRDCGGDGVSESEEGLNGTPYQSFESSEWQDEE